MKKERIEAKIRAAANEAYAQYGYREARDMLNKVAREIEAAEWSSP